MKDLRTRGETLQEISNKNPSLAEKFISYIKQMLDKFTSYFTGSLTTQQKDNIYNAFAKNVRAIKDAKGNKKFKVII